MPSHDEPLTAHNEKRACPKAIDPCAGAAMTIDSQDSFFEFLAKYATPENGTRRIFRGERLAKYDLLPGIARPKLRTSSNKPFTEKDEDLLLRHFKERAHRFVEQGYDDLSLLALAQHHGLPTRLLDWYYNPLVAVYMATEHDFSSEENKSCESSANWHEALYAPNPRTAEGKSNLPSSPGYPHRKSARSLHAASLPLDGRRS